MRYRGWMRGGLGEQGGCTRTQVAPWNALTSRHRDTLPSNTALLLLLPPPPPPPLLLWGRVHTWLLPCCRVVLPEYRAWRASQAFLINTSGDDACRGDTGRRGEGGLCGDDALVPPVPAKVARACGTNAARSWASTGGWWWCLWVCLEQLSVRREEVRLGVIQTGQGPALPARAGHPWHATRAHKNCCVSTDASRPPVARDPCPQELLRKHRCQLARAGPCLRPSWLPQAM